MCGGLRKPGWSRKKSFHVKWLNVKFFPYVSHYLSNFWKFIKNQRVKRFVKNKKHVIKYEQGKPKQKLTQFFYFSTSAWFPQTATHMYYTLILYFWVLCIISSQKKVNFSWKFLFLSQLFLCHIGRGSCHLW